jgi:hypothetical protein
MSAGQLARLSQWQSLRTQIAAELSDYQAYVKGELSLSAQEAIVRALKDSRSLISAGSNGAITAGFGGLNAAQVEQLLTFLRPGSVLYKRLERMPGVVATDFFNTFTEGVGLGWNPRKIVAMMRLKAGQGLTDALRMVRTAQLYSYREASRASYIANEDVVSGWWWLASLNSPNICMSCVRMHGTWHPNTERLNDHPNGPCAMVPAVRGYGNPFKETGEQWFRRQNEADQLALMGRDYHSAWKNNLYSFDKLSIERPNDVYGPMRTVTPLWQLLGAEPPLRVK